MKITIEWMDGVRREYNADRVTESEATLTIHAAKYYGGATEVTHKVALANVREVAYS